MQDKMDNMEKALAQKDARGNAAPAVRGRCRGGRGGANRGRNGGYGNNSYGGNSGNNNMSNANRKKLDVICLKYNQPGGCSRASCNFFHLCKKMLPTGLCGQQHPMAECPN